MSRIVAVFEEGAPSGKSILEAAQRLGELSGASVEAVYPPRSPKAAQTAIDVCQLENIHCKPLEEPAGSSLLESITHHDVIAAVVGSRGTGRGWQLVGPTALGLLRRTEKPVVIVGPNAHVPEAFRRLLIPLEGTESSTQPILDRLLPLLGGDVEIIVLHVFTEATFPRMLDRPVRDFEMLGTEFLKRHLPHAHRIELRHGSVSSELLGLCGDRGSDLIVLSWAQNTSRGRAQIIREVLAQSPLPVLLLAGPKEARQVPLAVSSSSH